MKGKIGLVVGLGVGYVLGTRAGQERYEQIKTQWLKVWNQAPVQEQVDKVKGFVGDKAAQVPGALWTGAVKIVKTVSGSGTPGQKLDATIAAGKDVADDVEDAVDEVKERVEKKTASDSAAKKPAAAKPAASKPTAPKTGD
jgi:hypothetical protein